MRTVIFDLDGTLADTSADLIAAANTSMQAMGHAPQLWVGQDDATAFRGGRAMLKLSLERMGHGDVAGEVERGYPILLAAYGEALDVYTRLYPGALDAVQALWADGFRVGVCTNKPELLADQLLQRLGVRDLFASLIGADTLPTRKPDPAPYVAAVEQAGGAVSRSLLVGDTVTDRDTARAAGVPSVLVTFGPLGQSVADMAPDALLGDFGQMLDVARALLD